MLTCARRMVASSQPKLCVIHIRVISRKPTIAVDGPKTAQLMPISIGPKFLSPEDGIVSLCSIARDNLKLLRRIVQSSLSTRRRRVQTCWRMRRGGDGSGGSWTGR